MVGLALVLLLLIFRSIVVPVVAALGFLLTIGVSFGAVVAVYQWGWLSGIFGVDTPAPIISFLPILLIGVLFGLAMDYQVFMVSGMRESYVHGAEAKKAVVSGWSAGARVVTAAGDHHGVGVRRLHPGAGHDHRLDRLRARRSVCWSTLSWSG